jgi:hypothetical protein
MRGKWSERIVRREITSHADLVKIPTNFDGMASRIQHRESRVLDQVLILVYLFLLILISLLARLLEVL